MFKEVNVPDPADARNPQSSDSIRHCSSTQNSIGKWLGQIALMAVAVTMIVPAVGCSGFRDAAMVSYRDMVWAKRAYNLRYGNCNRPYNEHFQNGFCEGYSSICNGGDGYVPAMPPADYRKFEYQSPEGAQCVNAWFEGYPAGVAAARKEKVGNYNDVMISRMIDSAITQEKTAFKLPAQRPADDSNRGRIETPPNPAIPRYPEPTAALSESLETNSAYMPESDQSPAKVVTAIETTPVETMPMETMPSQVDSYTVKLPPIVSKSESEPQSTRGTSGQDNPSLNIAARRESTESNRRAR
jgi:hypothetical protein